MIEDENNFETYRCTNKISASTIREIIKVCLLERLCHSVYDEQTSAELTRRLSENIKHKLKLLSLPSYKYIVQVMIGERREQGIRYRNAAIQVNAD